MHPARRALLAVAGAALIGAAAAQFGGMGGGGGPPKAKPQLADIPYIECQVCELLTKNAWRQVKELLKSASPTNKVDEMKIIEKMEKITTAWRPEGEWIASLDLVEQGDKLVVKEMGEVGKCGVECKTIEAAAERIMGEHDTDIAEMLFTGKKTRAQFSNWLCYEETGACSHKPASLPRNRQPGPPFEPMPAGEQNMERMLGEMQDKGLKGNLYSRDDLLAKYGMQEGDMEDEEGEGEGLHGQPIDFHHMGGGQPPYSTRSMQAAVGRTARAARAAAAAARDGVAAAGQRARQLWGKLQGGQKAKGGKQEL